MLIENTDKGSVITWDFDVMKHDVMFCVFRTVEAVKRKGGSTSAVTKEKKEELGSFNNMGTSGDPEHYTGRGPRIRYTLLRDDTTSTIIMTGIGRGWTEGKEYFRAEAPIVCHDGESIQGSHVTQSVRHHPRLLFSLMVILHCCLNQVGTYILQWSYFERVTLSGQSPDMWDNLTHPQHKAKLMFYYEVLNSLDYMGSMTSLQSTQSGFSSISKASGHHSTSGI